MLKKFDNRTVKGEWFTVHVDGIRAVEYREAGKSVRVEIEGGESAPREVDWVIYAKTFRDTTAIDTEGEDASTRTEIVKRISAALDVLGMPYKIV
jgi:hypothetical protein